jgi:putative hydrolase of the HAD superfamily
MTHETQGVVFDFYGTLIEEDPADYERDAAVLADYGYTFTDAIRRAWIEPIASLVHHELSTDQQRYAERRRELWTESLANAGVGADHLPELVAAAEERGLARTFTTYDDSVPALEALRARGLRTAVCSNWAWNLDEVVEACGLAGLVDAVVNSARVGYRKPHPALFEAVAGDLGVWPQRLMFVGDTWTADVAGARAVGMKAVHLVRSPGHDATPPEGVTTVASLLDLVSLLDAAS